MTRLLLLTALLLAPTGVGGQTPPPFAPTNWLVVGGPGSNGDCMMEWMLQAPTAAWVPHTESADATRLSDKQSCTDHDPKCDWEYWESQPKNGQCKFRMAMCFCVDDAVVGNCLNRREMWCDSQFAGTLSYRFAKPKYSEKESRGPESDAAQALCDALVHAGLTNLLPTQDCTHDGNNRFQVTLKKPLEFASSANNLNCVIPPGQPPGKAPPGNPSPNNPPTTLLPSGFSQWCAPCTELTTIIVPVKGNATAKFKGRVPFRTGFEPAAVDDAYDRLRLECLP